MKIFLSLFIAAASLWAAAPETYRFIVLGDRTGAAQKGVFEKVVAQAVQSAPVPAFFINVGDLIQGYGGDTTDLIQQWEEVKAQLAPITGKFPFHPVPGNHDMTAKEAGPFYGRYMGKRQYSFDMGPDRFIVMDNSDWVDDQAIGNERLVWLKKELSKPGPFRNTFVFYHKPLWNISPKEPHLDPLHALFKKHNVTYVFNGHHHEYRYGKRDNIVYIKVGSSGANTKRRKADGTLFHYMVVDVLKDKVIARPVALGGDTLPIDWVDETRAGEIAGFEGAFKIRPVLIPDTVSGYSGIFYAKVSNPLKTPFTVELAWALPNDAIWQISPSAHGKIALSPMQDTTLEYRFTASAHMPLPRLTVQYPFCGDTLTSSITPYIRRQMACPKVQEPPKVDGEINEAIWSSQGKALSNWFANGTRWSDSSWAALAYDGKNLYVAFKTFDPHPDSISIITPSPARDTFSENEDLFRFFFCAETDTGRFALVYVTPSGAFKDIMVNLKDDYFTSNAAWNAVSACKARKTASGWQGEFSIPWRNTPWKTPADLRINFKHENDRLARKGHRAYQMPYEMPPRYFGLARLGR